jgi:serine/threonine-protein kinase
MDGQVVGTPAYMPPEQASGRVDEIGPHSDVFAVGAMIYHLLAGRPPYEGKGAKEVWQRASAGAPPAIESLAPRAPAELAAICTKAMRPDWRMRYRDMTEMAADVSAFLEGRVVRAHATGALAESEEVGPAEPRASPPRSRGGSWRCSPGSSRASR